MKYSVLASVVAGAATAAKNPTNRDIIIGGVPAAAERYPWQAGLSTGQTDTTFFCGGTLISPGVVLSAAHCGTPYFVEVGCLLSADPCEQTTTSDAFFNPDFLSTSVGVYNDFSLLALSRDIVSVPPIPFLADASFSEIPGGQDVTVIGWGTTASGGELSPELMEVDVFVVDQDTCTEMYAAGGYDIDQSMICAADVGQDSCQGDSGGPLFIRCDENRNDVQLGVVSWGIGCALPEYPGVYSRVSDGRAWIDSILAGLNVTLATPDASNLCTGPSAPVTAPSPVPAPVPVNVPTVFPGWTCYATWYGDGLCDCECGVPDIDCEDPTNTVYGCLADEICIEGVCFDTPDPTPTESPVAEPTEAPVPTESPVPVHVPTVFPGWTCYATWYGDGLCDCECGVPDIDCEDPTNTVVGCLADEICIEGVCFGTPDPTPTESPVAAPTESPVPVNVPTVFPGWTCLATWYGDGLCDCECGAPDIDCEDPTNGVVGCLADEICIEGVCFGTPDPTPTASPVAAPTVSLVTIATEAPTETSSTGERMESEFGSALYVLVGLLALAALLLAIVLFLLWKR